VIQPSSTTSTTSSVAPPATTTSSTSSSGGSSGIPELPYQPLAMVVVALLIVTSYLLVSRNRPKRIT
jgi:ABC-type Na+ efflux pump permease subunit